jgi:hypothetical protein
MLGLGLEGRGGDADPVAATAAAAKTGDGTLLRGTAHLCGDLGGHNVLAEPVTVGSDSRHCVCGRKGLLFG